MASPLGISGTTSRIPFSNCCSTTVFKSLNRLSSFRVTLLNLPVSVPCLKVDMHGQASKVITLYNI